jgi:cytochrome c oxidase subunit IV
MEEPMKTNLRWTTGKVVYLYFCGVLLGVFVSMVVQAVSLGEGIRFPIVGVLLALGLVVLPVADAAKSGREVASG